MKYDLLAKLSIKIKWFGCSFDDIRYYVTRGVYDLIPSCKIEWDANIHY